MHSIMQGRKDYFCTIYVVLFDSQKVFLVSIQIEIMSVYGLFFHKIWTCKNGMLKQIITERSPFYNLFLLWSSKKQDFF